jgi:hypothetical protein
MKKLLTCIGIVMAVSASGCVFYFGPDHHDDRYYWYCDETGCWSCDSYTGECWEDGGSSGCQRDADCAAGCYCQESNGVCIETGFCSVNEDCADGFVCDDRASCVPENDGACWETGCPWGYYCDAWTGDCVPTTTCEDTRDCGPGYMCVEGACVPVGCTDDDQCAAGCYCDEDTGACVETSYCDGDADCGDGLTCDEDRSTCIPGEDPVPACDTLTAEAACLARDDCNPIYAGVNCTPECTVDPNSPECRCEYYYFALCTDG